MKETVLEQALSEDEFCPYKDELWVYENAKSDGMAILQALEDMEALL